MANELENRRKQNIFTQIGKTLTATSLGLQGKDPSSVFDDLNNQLTPSDILAQAQLAELINPGSGSEVARMAISAPRGKTVSNQPQETIRGEVGVREQGEQQGDLQIIPKTITKKNLTGTTTYDVERPPEEQGRIEGIKKAEGEKAEKSVKSSQVVARQDRMVRTFVNSFQELQEQFPDIGETSFSGFVSRLTAQGAEKLGMTPDTTRYLNRVEVAANKQAREIEGGRVTDQDRQIYVKAMQNAAKFPTSTNIGLAADSLIDIYQDYDNTNDIIGIVSSYISSPIDVLQNIGLEAVKVGVIADENFSEKVLNSLSEDQLNSLTNEQLKMLVGQ